jgi:hypothetical protein
MRSSPFAVSGGETVQSVLLVLHILYERLRDEEIGLESQFMQHQQHIIRFNSFIFYTNYKINKLIDN